MAGLFHWGGKKNCFQVRFEGEKMAYFGEEGEIKSLHVEIWKTGKGRGPTVETLVQGVWRLRLSEAERRVREGMEI